MIRTTPGRLAASFLVFSLLSPGCAARSYRSPRSPQGVTDEGEADAAETVSTGGGGIRAASASRRYRRAPGGQPRGGQSRYAKNAPGRANASPAGRAATGRPAAATDGSQAVARGAEVPSKRMIVYTARVHLRVLALTDALETAQKVALEHGAYLQTRSGKRLTFRVPVERFHSLLSALSGLGEVASKHINAQDVTQKYYDLQLRLQAAEAVLERLKALLARAKNVKESLAIEREMARLLERIERFKGKLRYLRHHAALSTISIHFRIKPRFQRPVDTQWKSPFRWVNSLGLWRMMRR